MLGFLDALNQRVLVCDGAMGTQLYARGVFVNRCFDELNLTDPDLVRQVHREYATAGAEMLETNTFGASFIGMEEFQFTRELVREINPSTKIITLAISLSLW